MIPILHESATEIDPDSEENEYALVDVLAENIGIICSELVAFGFCDQETIGKTVGVLQQLSSVNRRGFLFLPLVCFPADFGISNLFHAGPAFVSSMAAPITNRLVYQLFHMGTRSP